MRVEEQQARLLVQKLEPCACDYDFDWRLYARLCIAAGMKGKFREVVRRVEESFRFPFYSETAGAVVSYH